MDENKTIKPELPSPQYTIEESKPLLKRNIPYISISLVVVYLIFCLGAFFADKCTSGAGCNLVGIWLIIPFSLLLFPIKNLLPINIAYPIITIINILLVSVILYFLGSMIQKALKKFLHVSDNTVITIMIVFLVLSLIGIFFYFLLVSRG